MMFQYFWYILFVNVSKIWYYPFHSGLFRNNKNTIEQCFITTQKQACVHFKLAIFWQNKKNKAKVHANEQFVNKANFLLMDNSVKKEILQ